MIIKVFVAVSISLLGFMCWIPESLASGGTGVYPLNWSNPKEVLEYHSCGCADSCWIAELRNRKTRQLKAKLRCDCERTYLMINATERLFQDDCRSFETDHKAEVIRHTLELILKHQP